MISNKKDVEIHSPFKLQLIIHGAENLPIADLTTSDPFVAISIGGRYEGRTKTIYRNRSPTWDEIFNLKLLHRRSVVTLKIFDEDRGKDDDLLGTVSIDLADISLEQKSQKKYPVVAHGNFDTKSSKLDVSILVRSNEAVIKVVPDNRDESAAAEVGDSSPLSPDSSLGESYICEVVEEIVTDCPQMAAPESVVNALTRFITKDKVPFFAEDLLRDLLWDAGSLTKSSAEAASLIKGSSRQIYNRTHLRLQNSSKILMNTKSCYWHPPIPKNTIQMNLCPNDSRFVSIEFHNRLAMWVCARWLFMLYDFWKGVLKPADLPSWSANCTYAAQCSLNISDGRVITGRMVLAVERPFEVRINEEYVSFKSIHSLILASDSLLPKTYIMDIEILSYSATGEYSKEDQAMMTPEAAPAAPVKKGIFQTVRMNIRSTVKGVASGAVHVVSGATDAAVSTTIGVASTTIGAARTLATGNPISIIHSAQDNLFAVGKDIRSILKDATSVLGEASTYITAKFDNVAQVAHKTQHIYIDCSEDSFANRQVNTLRRSSINHVESVETGTVETVLGVYPSSDRSSSSVSLLLCHGNDTVQMVLGHKRLTAAMLQQKSDIICEVPLNSQLGFGITVVNSRNLQLTSPAKATLGGGGMHMKMKFTDKHGNSGTLGRLQEVKTNSMAPTPNPDWNCSAVFKAQDGFENAAFLRIEVCLDDFTTNFIVGTCFIPLEMFRSKAKEYTFPMTRYKNTAVHFRDAYIQNGLGETTFRIHRIEEDSNSPATVALRSTLIESNIYNTRWFSECLPAGTVNADHLKDVEEFSVMATQEGLEMVSVNKNNADRGADRTDVFSQPASSAKKETSSDRRTETSVDSLALTEDWRQSPTEELTQEVVVEVFENQRRQPYYPFDWSNKAYTRPLFSDITYTVAYKFDSVEAAQPPPGFKWASNWCFDKAYADTDENGWSYGMTFGMILSNHKQGKSNTKPAKMMARRRKWVRKAVCVDRASTIGRNAMHIFETANTAKGTALPHTSSSNNMNTSFHGQAPGTPKTPQSQEQPKLASWRNDYLLHFPNALVSVCQERSSSQSSVLVPWKQVKDVYMISPSVLSLVVQVNRYLYDKHAANIGFFRPADVEIFISNCPAAELKSMIEERKWFDSFKCKIRSLVASGTTSGFADGDEDNLSDAGDFVPATEELSMGSELVAELDEHSIALEDRVRQIDKYIGLHNTSVDKAAQKEKSIILRRDCRLRAYMAALFGVGLKGDHTFVESEIKAIMDRDFKISQNIKHKTEVATANNRIEFYLDTAEKRIRDAVLCGWNYREGGKLERCLEIFANGYFIEIVGLLGTFFEDTGGTAVQGLGSKVELINTYLKHNDRLATILDHALRPYALKAEPAATLSLFLDFDILVSWYTSVLLLEMRDRVNDVLALWKDRTKDVTGRAQQYKYPVPWVPQQVESEDTNFFSYIPEDLVEVLLTYLQYARIRKDTVAPSFQDSVGRLDTEVLMAYTSSFLYLSEQITEQLNSKDWASAAAEEELSEYATWLASVANDAHRVEANQLHAPNRVADAAKEDEKFQQDTQENLKKEGAVEKRTIKSFLNISMTALDHLSCIVYIYVFHERTDLLSDNLYKKWLDTLPKDAPLQGEGEAAIIPSVMEDVTFFLQEKQAFLSPFCYCNLVSLCADKMYVVYLSLFKIAHRYGGAFEAKERAQIRADIEAIRSGFEAALEDGPPNSAEYRKFSAIIKEKFVPLDYCCDLLRDELGTAAFDDTMKKLQTFAEKNATDAASLASMIETCLGLKGVSKYSTRRKAAPRKSEAGAPPRAPTAAAPVIAATAPSTPASAAKASDATPPPAASAAPAKRRGSMFDYFTGHGHHTDAHPVAVPVAAVAHAPTPPTPIPAESTHSASRESPATEPDDADADEEAELQMARQLREKAIVDCVALMIQVIRSHSVFKSVKHTSLSKSSPLERVFGTDFSSEFSLDVQVLHSARPPTAGVTGAVASSSYFSAFTGMFGSRNKQQRAASSNHHHHIAPAGSSSPMSPMSDDAGDLGQLSLTGLKVEDLFYLDSLRNPHPYLKIQFGKFVFSTKVLLADTNADWSAEDPIIVPLRGIGTSDSARSSMAELHITLYYKGFLTDQVIGTVAVPFAPYAPPLFNDKRFTIADFKSPQAILAAKKAETEGRNHPSIIISMGPAVATPPPPVLAPATA